MGNIGIINIKVRNISQLFNSLDASPFIEKDLDDDAVDYIVSSAKDLSPKKEIKLIINTRNTKKNRALENKTKVAIMNFFEYLGEIEQKKIRYQFNEAIKILLKGLSFLASCLLLREGLLQIMNEFVFNVIAEGLVIIGWVAMWKPISEILYEWLPKKRNRDIYLKLSKIEIEFVYE